MAQPARVDGSREYRILSLPGSDEEARSLAAKEFTRIADELERDESTSDAPELDMVFTAHLWPAADDYDPRTLAEDLIPLQFPWDDPALLARMMAREVEDLYVVSGLSRARDLLGSIAYSANSHMADPLGADADSLFRNVIPFSSWSQAHEAGRKVSLACDEALRGLANRAAKAVVDVENRAAALGFDRLVDARTEVLVEAVRYLDLGGERRAAGEALVTGNVPPSQVLLRGPGVAPLVAALRDIAARRRALDAATSTYAANEAAIKANRPPAYVQLIPIPTGFADVTPEEMTRAFPNAAGAVESATTDLAQAVTVYCRAFPILGRIWKDHELPDSQGISVRADGGEGLVATTAAGGLAISRLKDAILDTLRTTWTANNALKEELYADAGIAWRYPPLILAALDDLHDTDPSIEFRAAQERLEEENALSVTSTLAMVNGALATGAWLSGAAPHVELALACTSAVLSVVGAVQDFAQTQVQKHAFEASLDPSKSIASEPGYAGLIVGVAFALLDLKGVRDGLRAARLANEVGIAQVAEAVSGW